MVQSPQSWVQNQFTFFLLPLTALFGLPLLLVLWSVIVFSILTMERGIYLCHLIWTQLCHFFAEIIFLWEKSKQKQHTRNPFEAYTIWICMHTCVSTFITGHLILTHSLITIAFLYFLFIFPVILDLPVLMKCNLDHKVCKPSSLFE